MKKLAGILLAILICSLCLTGCGIRDDWNEEKGELVKKDYERPALFVLDRKEVD